MAIFKALALATILATLTSAAPVQQQQKRALVYETVTKIDVTTIDTTVTIYGAAATSAVQVNQGVPPAAATTTAAPAPPPPAPSSKTTTTSVSPPASETTTSAPPPPPPATTSAPPPPAETTTAAPPPPPAPSTTTAAAPAPQSTTTSSTGGSTGQTSTGDGTYYQTATSMSAPSYCDTANDGSSENVVALSADIMNQSLCGATITVTHEGKTAQGKVVDRCAGCSAGSVDMSEHMFGVLADMSAGRIPISWSFDN